MIQVPMFWPIIRGIAIWKETTPVELTACRMPMEAEELWIRAVTAAPTRIPSRGLEKATNSSRKAGSSWRPETAFSMVFMPMNRRPSPSRIWPTICLRLLPLRNMKSTMPTAASRGPRIEGLSRAKKTLSDEMSPSRRSCAVTVVPMLAPMIIPTVWGSFMMPALTKPTHITVVAAEL